MVLQSFFEQFESVSFKKNDILLHPDDIPKGIHYVEKGHVKLYSLTEWGDEKLHFIYKESEMFPLFWTFDNAPLTKYYEAFTDLIVRVAPKQSFLQFIEHNPKAQHEVIRRMTQILEVYSDRVDNLEYTNSYARLCSRLLYLAKRFGEKRGQHVLIHCPITHKDIASSIAMTRETTSREFEKLEKKNIVRYVNHLIVICDAERLREEISAHYDKKLL